MSHEQRHHLLEPKKDGEVEGRWAPVRVWVGDVEKLPFVEENNALVVVVAKHLCGSGGDGGVHRIRILLYHGTSFYIRSTTVAVYIGHLRQ